MDPDRKVDRALEHLEKVAHRRRRPLDTGPYLPSEQWTGFASEDDTNGDDGSDEGNCGSLVPV